MRDFTQINTHITYCRCMFNICFKRKTHFNFPLVTEPVYGKFMYSKSELTHCAFYSLLNFLLCAKVPFLPHIFCFRAPRHKSILPQRPIMTLVINFFKRNWNSIKKCWYINKETIISQFTWPLSFKSSPCSVQLTIDKLSRRQSVSCSIHMLLWYQ